jgi:hypothetical protein
MGGRKMALGEYTIFSWKNKATQEREQTEYAKWAFPYGETQRENLQALLLSVYPKETVPTTLIPFLTCKELYEGILKKSASRDEALDILINKQKKYKRIIRKNDMTMYLALVLADAETDERCEYPTADEIRASAQALEKYRTAV